MHMMIAGAVLHATALGVLAFFILFAASKAEGFVKLLGNILGIWVLLIAVCAVVFGVWHAIHGGPDRDVDRMHHSWFMMWHDHGPMGPPPGVPQANAPAAAPAAPAPAAPAPATKH